MNRPKPFCFICCKYVKHQGTCPALQKRIDKIDDFYKDNRSDGIIPERLDCYGDKLKLGFAMMADDYED